MFIEGVRRAKNKWRIGVAVLLGLIIVSLVLSFAFFGSSIGGAADSAPSDILGSAEYTAEAAAEAVKGAEGDMTVLGQAASAYLSLAAYQVLYMEDPTKAYKEALKYAEEMVAACGSTEAADYNTAYGYVLQANAGLGDAAALSTAFNASLDVVTIDESYINAYYNYMDALGATEQFMNDMETVKAILEPLAEDAPAEDEATEEDIENPGDSGTPAAVLDYIEELLVAAKVEVATSDEE
ncbi:MAG: hypothetical protein IKV45_04315 [Firmicutes bacterium]|nr:hypothetical protein [Bacillota bacterium]